MGTRNLTAVYLNGKYKIAQYGQWDGYPDEGGLKVLDFARRMSRDNKWNEFKYKVFAAKFFSDDALSGVNYAIDTCGINDWESHIPEISRNTGVKILDVVFSRPDGIKLVNSIEFAVDPWCEWVWVIDLDAGTFEGFYGYIGRELEPSDRFYFLKGEIKEENAMYSGVALVAKWNLDNLPTDEEFLKAFEVEEDQEE